MLLWGGIVALIYSLFDKKDREIGYGLVYHDGREKYIYDSVTKERILDRLDEIRDSDISQRESEIFAYKRDGLWGYFNYVEKKVVTEPIYDYVWRFRYGAGWVAQNEEVFFVDNTGEPLAKKRFPRVEDWKYEFIGIYSKIKVGGELFSVDRDGNLYVMETCELLGLPNSDSYIVNVDKGRPLRNTLYFCNQDEKVVFHIEKTKETVDE